MGVRLGQPNIFEQDLDQNPANFQPLTPLSFLDWAARVYPDKTAVIHGPHRLTWRAFDDMCRRFASGLMRRGVSLGDTVSILATNTPPMFEAQGSPNN